MIMDQPTKATDQADLAAAGFEWRERNGVRILVSTALEQNGFANGFSTRLGGVSPFPGNDLNLAGFNEDSAENIYENRRRFISAFDRDFRLSMVWQIHGDDIKVVRTLDDIGDSEDKADAVISDLSGILAGAKTADCVPVLIGDPKKRAYSAVHAGWRGTVSSIVVKAIAKLTKEYGCDPNTMIAAIGPAAGCANYEIGPDVIKAFDQNFPATGQYFSPTHDGHALVDLHRANRDQLVSAGVLDSNIYTAPFCTMERPDLFFSYRLEKQKFGKTGRLLSVIGRQD